MNIKRYKYREYSLHRKTYHVEVELKTEIINSNKKMKISAGILLYRGDKEELEFFLVRPGGPFYKASQDGIWCFPKGEVKKNETEIEAAKREFKEETGFSIKEKIYPLGQFKLRKGKIISAYYCKKDLNPKELKSSLFEMEYPKKSGVKRSFSEIEEGNWFSLEEAKLKLLPKLLPFVEKLIEIQRNKTA
jgi:predicted NUDIX family NTP pyrophosphohydrolase